MKSKFLVTLAIMLGLLIGCEDPALKNPVQDEGPRLVDGRLVFDSNEQYVQTLDYLDKATQPEQIKWQKKFPINPLLAKISGKNVDESLRLKFEYYSNSHRMVINEKGLIQIGENVVLFDGKEKYFIPQSNYRQDMSNDELIKAAVDQGSMTFKLLNSPTLDANGRTHVTAPSSGVVGVGGSQNQFSLSDGSQRKFVTEFWGGYENLGGGTYVCNGASYNERVSFGIRLKLEGRANSRRSWAFCGDDRTVVLNFSTENMIVNVKSGCTVQQRIALPVTINTTYTHVTNELPLTLASFTEIFEEYYIVTYSVWDTYVTGTTAQTYTNMTPQYTFTYNM